MVKAMIILQALMVNLCLMLSLPALAADIQVSVDRNPVNVNESFQIVFSASEEPDGNPDFTPLQQNFEILDRQRSSNASWVNGKSSRSEQWTLQVLAKQPGELLIPPIAFGADISKPLSIVVSENQTAQQNNEDIFLEVSVSNDKPYVQSQVLYTFKLFRRLQITQARLDEPQLKDSVVEKLGEDSTYTTVIQGVNYWVTERKYAIFPQQSGTVTIAPLTLNAEVLVQHRPSFNGFFNSQSTETRRVVSKAITLNVQAVPEAFKSAAWLSAESLQLVEDWSDKSLQVKVGDPLTRTLRLTAKGSTVGQLPELAGAGALNGMKSYPDQPVLKEDKQSDGLTALREEKIAYIPSKPGDYTLPAVEINWFNTKTQKIETAVLPSVTIKALAAAADQPTPQSQLAETETPAPTVPTPVSTDNNDLLFWKLMSAFLGLGWLLTLVVLYLYSRKKSANSAVIQQQTPASAYAKTLKHACWENNPLSAKQALLLWGKRQFAAESLGAIASLCDEPLRREIDKLNQYLYSGRQQAWEGQPLWLAFDACHMKTGAAAVADDGLEPLYKL